MLHERGEFVDAQGLSPDGAWVRYGGPRRARRCVTDGPFPEAKELIAGWFMIDVESEARAHEVAAYVSSAPGQGRRADLRVDRGPRRCHGATPTAERVTEELLRDLAPQVLGVLVRRGADFAAAEDAVQEALLEAHRTWAERLPDDPKAWLVTVARRKLVDTHRSETARRRREDAVVARAAGRGRPSSRTTPCCCCSCAATRRSARRPRSR